MPIGAWNEPVIVLLGMAGNLSVTVTNAARAAQILLNDWPTDRGPMHLRAQTQCLHCLLGECDPEEAREAFIEAASEAGILAE